MVLSKQKQNLASVAEFESVMGTSLEHWLRSNYFQFHASHFKNRPILWHICSVSDREDRRTAKNSASFQFLMSYLRLDSDSIPKIRSNYLGTVRQRLETELRGITSISEDARDEKQIARSTLLEDRIFELNGFDELLREIENSGFGPHVQYAKLRQSAINDSLHTLKSVWINRLASFITSNHLKEWIDLGDSVSLHPDLGGWMQDALLSLGTKCTELGFSNPKQEKFSNDPTSVDFAALIVARSDDMVVDSIKAFCQMWYQRLDEVVFKSLKDKLKSLKLEQSELVRMQDELQSEEDLSLVKIGDLKEAIKRVKAEIKNLNAELKTKTSAAKKLRENIEAWRSDEPTKWGDWLAEQPMFDQISSLDDRRPPPKTIAEFVAQESMYVPNFNDGVRVNIAPLQKAGILAADVLAPKDVDKAIADRAEWRADERRWVRKGILPRPGWWPEPKDGSQPEGQGTTIDGSAK